ncbi:MAG TPA: CCA tRNA nucleotidyltransferase [Bryobacteraceae bacterium]|nr:CCA tRNA nucleotidyltransferase [Bryobacteraceae bacterium]
MAGSAALARSIVSTLRAHGFQGWFVGGCVRDALLGRDPKDYDVSTDARPDQVLALWPRAQQVGAKFGVVLVTDGGESVEVVTFRSDEAYHDGRHPEGVRFETDPRQDVLRRDFTINALMRDPFSGEVIDYTGGRQDLERGLIRAIGDPAARFEEDHLRMLRAVRFAARFRFTIEPATLAAIQALHGEIARISPERIRDELSRILTEGGARRGFELLDESGLLTDILPEVAAMKGVQQPPEYHPEGDVWTHTLMMLERVPPDPPLTLSWGVLLHDVGKPPTFRIAERIRFDGHVEAGVRMTHDILCRLHYSNAEVEQVQALVANHMRFAEVFNMRESTVKRFLRLPHFEQHLELNRLDCLCSNGMLASYEYMKDRFEHAPEEELRPPRLVSGRDLIAAGYRPGPQFSRMLELAEDAQLEGRIGSREQGLELVAAEFGRPKTESAADEQ